MRKRRTPLWSSVRSRSSSWSYWWWRWGCWCVCLWGCWWIGSGIAVVDAQRPLSSSPFSVVWSSSSSSAPRSVRWIAREVGLDVGAEVWVDLMWTSSSPLLDSTSPTVFLSFVLEQDLETFQTRLSASSSLFCSGLPSVARYRLNDAARGSDSTVSFSFRSLKDEQYALIILNCGHIPISISGSWSFRQGSGSYLSLEDIPLVQTSFALSILHTLNFTLLLYLLISFRATFRKHHCFLIVVVVLHVTYIWLQYAYISLRSSSGYSNELLRLFFRSFQALSNASLLAFILFISLGWSFLRARLNFQEFALMSIGICVYGILRGLELTCVGPSSCSGFSLASTVLFFIYVIGMLIMLSICVERLRIVIGQELWPISRMEILRRFRVYKSLVVMFSCSYLFFPILSVFIRFYLFTWRDQWFNTLLFDLVDWVFLLFILVEFRPHPQITLQQIQEAQRRGQLIGGPPMIFMADVAPARVDPDPNAEGMLANPQLNHVHPREFVVNLSNEQPQEVEVEARIPVPLPSASHQPIGSQPVTESRLVNGEEIHVTRFFVRPSLRGSPRSSPSNQVEDDHGSYDLSVPSSSSLALPGSQAMPYISFFLPHPSPR